MLQALEQITNDIEKCKKLLNGFINYYLKKNMKTTLILKTKHYKLQTK